MDPTAQQTAMRRIQAVTCAAGGADRLAHVKQAPLDAILGTKILFAKDTNPNKMNLGVGAYRTEEGVPYVLNVVREADRLVAADRSLNKEYLPQSGLPALAKVSQRLLFGDDSAAVREGRVATVQSLSGTGALRVAAAFIKKHFPGAAIYYSNPTWGNHKAIFNAAGVRHGAYRYWDAKNRRLDLDGMLADLRGLPAGTFVLLHACAHNPTGVDPTQEQWKRIAAVVAERGLIPFFDSAYQGFATGDLHRDAWAIRYFTSLNLVGQIVCQSYAKNLGLYNERVGTFSVLCASAASAKAVVSQINLVIRPMYSNPPSHGAFLVVRILSDPQLFRQWTEEMAGMSQRIQAMRSALRGELERLGTPGDWSHITSQIGMFSFTGLSPSQCDSMIKKHHVYMLKNGRISMSGINSKNVAYLARAIDAVVRRG